MNIKDIQDIKTSTWFNIVITCLATFLPGTLYLYLFNKDLLIELDIFKILLLTTALFIPVWVLNFVLSIIIIFRLKCPGLNLEINFLFPISLIMTIISSYISIFFAWVNPSYFNNSIIITEIILFIISIIIRNKMG